MRSVDALEALVHAPLFRGLTRASLEPLAPALRRKEIRKGGFVWLDGSPATVIYVVLEGRIECFKTSSRGEQLVVEYYTPGGVAGLPSILVDGATRMTEGRAVEDTVVLTIDRESLFQLLEREPALMRRLFDNIGRVARAALHTLSEVTFLDVRGRVAHKLSDLAMSPLGEASADGEQIVVKISQRALAGLVAASREKVNRALARLAADGVVHQDAGKITIVDPPRLRKYVTELQPDPHLM
jgi:CRP-like cAMP-binding protein